MARKSEETDLIRKSTIPMVDKTKLQTEENHRGTAATLSSPEVRNRFSSNRLIPGSVRLGLARTDVWFSGRSFRASVFPAIAMEFQSSTFRLRFGFIQSRMPVSTVKA
jgi:hypothetical protein